MAINKVQETGNLIPVVAGSKVTSGQLVLVNKLAGIADGAAEAGETYQLDTAGVFEVPKTASVVFSVGDPAYGKGDGSVNATDSNPLVGHVVEAAGNTVSLVKVRLQSGK